VTTTISPEDLEILGDYRTRMKASLRITPKEGGTQVPLIPNAIQNEYLDATCYSPYLNPAAGGIPISPWTHEPFTFRNLILKPRQIGMSTVVLAKKLTRIVSEPNRNLVIIAQDDAMKDEFRERTHAFLEQYAENQQCPRYGSEAGKGKLDNKERLDFEINSTIYFQSAQSPNIGRTVTFHDVYGTELAFWDMWGEGNARSIISALNASVPRPPYGEIDFESTPNGPAGAFFDLCMAALEGKITDIGGGLSWKLFFWPWWRQQEYCDFNVTSWAPLQPLDEHERWLRDDKHLTPGQMSWRRGQVATATALRKEFDQEYPEDPMTCFITGQQTVIPKKVIGRMRAYSLREESAPLDIQQNGDLRIFEGAMPDVSYILAADGAHGNQGDDESAFVICRKDTMEPVVTYNGYLPIHEFAQLCVRMGFQYNTAYFAGESNNDVGYALNTKVDAMGYPNIHWRINPEQDLRHASSANPFALGWQTNVKTRSEMVATLQDWLIGTLVRIRDRVLVDQVATFIWLSPRSNPNAKKRAEAAPSSHDDLLFAYMIALQVREYATDVKGRGKPVRL